MGLPKGNGVGGDLSCVVGFFEAEKPLGSEYRSQGSQRYARGRKIAGTTGSRATAQGGRGGEGEERAREMRTVVGESEKARGGRAKLRARIRWRAREEQTAIY